MPANVVDRWLYSRRPARIAGMNLRPVEQDRLPGTPLSIRRGQAESFVLIRDDNTRWILKKCNPGRELDRRYLESVGRVLPRHNGLRAGVERRVARPIESQMKVEELSHDLRD